MVVVSSFRQAQKPAPSYKHLASSSWSYSIHILDRYQKIHAFCGEIVKKKLWRTSRPLARLICGFHPPSPGFRCLGQGIVLVALVLLIGYWRWTQCYSQLAGYIDALASRLLQPPHVRTLALRQSFGFSLAGVDLAGASLAGASLADARLTGVSLAGARLASASLFGARLANASLVGVSHTGVSLVGTRLAGVSLASACLTDVSLAGASLAGASLGCHCSQLLYPMCSSTTWRKWKPMMASVIASGNSRGRRKSVQKNSRQ